jgi:hypothetical protein
MNQEWIFGLVGAVEEFAHRSGRSKLAVAQAIGFSRHLSPSTLAGRDSEVLYYRLCGAFAAPNVPVVAIALGLDLGRYVLVENFFRDAVNALQGWAVDPRAARGAAREAVDWGMAGVELYDQGLWDVAAPYLEKSWIALHTPPYADSPLRTHALLRVGSQLVSYDGHCGQTARTQRIISELSGVCRSVTSSRASTAPLLDAAGLFLTVAGVAYRLFGTLPSLELAAYSREAEGLLARSASHNSGRIGALRDQAKPLLRFATGQSNRREAQDRANEAWEALERAEAYAGGRDPREDLREAWLLTRLTEVECRFGVGQNDHARRLWDDTMGRDWIPPLIDARSRTPLASKVAVAEIAVAAAGNRLEEASALASVFLNAPENARFANRATRVAEMLYLSELGDTAALQARVLK